MDFLQAIENLQKDGVRAIIVFDEKSLQKLLLYSLAFAVVWGIGSALVRKYIA